MDLKPTRLIPIPLPTEIPEPPSLDKLPLDVVHSATVEMLLQQNEDLSARLKVNIRRNSTQEQDILKLRREIHLLDQKMESMKAKNEIVNEKEAIWRAQKEAKNRQMQASEKEKQLLELRYNELYTATQFRHKELHDSLSQSRQHVHLLEQKITRFKQIKERGKDKIRQLLLNTADYVRDDYYEKQRLQGQNNLFETHINHLRERFSERESFLKNKITELSELSKTHIRRLEGQLKDKDTDIAAHKNRLQSLENIHRENMTQEIQLERTKQRELELRIVELRNQIDAQLNNQSLIEKMQGELSELSNAKIQAARDFESQLTALKVERSSMAQDNEHLKQSQGELSAQLAESQKTLRSCETKLLEVSQENHEMAQELEKMKTLWFDSQERYEKARLSNEALKRINRELATRPVSPRAQKSIESAQDAPTTDVATNDEIGKYHGIDVNQKLSKVFAGQFESLKDMDFHERDTHKPTEI